ncbi:hypothetical protein [Spartinivicinus ruber]|uniref:hypothetical protein n=1 Tax=Spartinivicinus ruber TaxID=2683272 RepID=UPI0013D54EB8|nr:hypothetical protein [Spartinivicinus ruber]
MTYRIKTFRGSIYELYTSIEEPSEGFNPIGLCSEREIREFFQECVSSASRSPNGTLDGIRIMEYLLGFSASEQELEDRFVEAVEWNRLYIASNKESILMPFVVREKKHIPTTQNYKSIDQLQKDAAELKADNQDKSLADTDIEFPNWLKIQANYDDAWNTPLPAENVQLSIMSNLINDKVTLNKGIGINSIASNIDEARTTAKEPGVAFIESLPIGSAQVDFQRQPGLEKKIASLREALEMKLDGAYRDTVKQMSEFQGQWETYGYMSIALSGGEGLYAGSSDWIDDQADLFEAETWSKLGDTISEATGKAFDTAADYAQEVYERAVKNANEAAEWVDEHSDELHNFHWWSTQAETAIEEAKKAYRDHKAKVQQHLDDAADFLSESKEKVEKLYKYKEEILKLPQYITEGDPIKVENFVDTVLMDVDPELANSVKNNPNFYIALELIADHDSALTYFAYVDLFMEAVPPNFYAYIAGKGGSYIAIEVLLLIALSFLTLGTGTIARITMLGARLATSSARVAGVTKKITQAQAAIQAFKRTLEDFADSTKILKDLGETLHKARNGSITQKGSVNSTLTIKKQNQKRNSRCRICHKSDHTTPRSQRGCVVYK